jgi:chromosome segregation ATPase
LLLEHELEGTMRRVLNLNQSDPSGSKRSLDYAKLIGEKETALNDKERKIMNYEERLRLAEEKVIALEYEIQNLNGVINQRNSQIQELRRQLEIKATAIDKIRGQPSFANSQELREILRVVRLE